MKKTRKKELHREGEPRITPREMREKGVKYVLDRIKRQPGYYVTNTERDLSQSDFKNRIMPHTQLLVAEERNRAGFFSLEITGGASVHVDMLRKQINPLEKLQVLGERMPDTMFQTLCRGINLFGYRPYPDNVVRMTVRTFARYVHVWRVFDFLNHIPNMVPVFEEVKAAGCILEPSICFSTGPEHTDAYYVRKVGEILDVTGEDILLCIKNHGGLGTSKRIGDLVRAIHDRYPDLVIHYHGHNTDGEDIGRILAAVINGAKIVDASDHAFTGFYGPPPLLSVVDILADYGYQAAGLDRQAVIETSNKLRPEREYYRDFDPVPRLRPHRADPQTSRWRHRIELRTGRQGRISPEDARDSPEGAPQGAGGTGQLVERNAGVTDPLDDGGEQCSEGGTLQGRQ